MSYLGYRSSGYDGVSLVGDLVTDPSDVVKGPGDTPGTTADNILLWDNTTGTLVKDSGSKLSDLAPLDIFGSEYQSAENKTGQTSTTAFSFVNHVSLTTTSLPAGDYNISWYYEWAGDGNLTTSQLGNFYGRVILNKTVFPTTLSGTFSCTNGQLTAFGTIDVIDEIFIGDEIQIIGSVTTTHTCVSYAPSLGAGNLIIFVPAWTGTTSAGLTIKKAVTLSQSEVRPSSAASNPFIPENLPGVDSANRYFHSGNVKKTLSGVHVLDIDFGTNLEGTESGIQNGRLEIYRVS